MGPRGADLRRSFLKNIQWGGKEGSGGRRRASNPIILAYDEVASPATITALPREGLNHQTHSSLSISHAFFGFVRIRELIHSP